MTRDVTFEIVFAKVSEAITGSNAAEFDVRGAEADANERNAINELRRLSLEVGEAVTPTFLTT